LIRLGLPIYGKVFSLDARGKALQTILLAGSPKNSRQVKEAIFSKTNNLSAQEFARISQVFQFDFLRDFSGAVDHEFNARRTAIAASAASEEIEALSLPILKLIAEPIDLKSSKLSPAEAAEADVFRNRLLPRSCFSSENG